MMKSFTDLEQSEKLAKILSLESADGGWYGTNDPLAANTTFWLHTKYNNKAAFPAWSLAALFNILPMYIGDFSKVLYYYDGYYCAYFDGGAPDNGVGDGFMKTIEQTYGDTPVDAVFKMIVQLKERGLL